MGAVRRISPSFFYSVGLHLLLLLVWGILPRPEGISYPKREEKFVIIEVDPPQSKDADSARKQVVQTEKGRITEKAAPDAFLGERTQTVDRTSVTAPKTGTAAASSLAGKKSRSESRPVSNPAASPQVISGAGALAKFGIAISTTEKESPKPQIRNPVEEGSLTAQVRGEYVKGFKEGEQTMLNTREFVFYGYFQRIRQRLDRAWEVSLRERLEKYFYRGRQLASETDYVTQILVALDARGRITKVQVIGASGTRDLDEAAIKAFNDAGPFPNPPSGLVDGSGQVFVRWDFVLKT